MAEPSIQVLIVEDDEVDREIVRRQLGRRYAVREVETGEQALAFLGGEPPDCVLLDYRLPDMAGLDLVPSFAAAYVPVVMLTGEERPEVIVEAMQQGAQDYLVKGQASAAALDRAIMNAVEKAGLQKTLARQQQLLAEQSDALQAKNRQLRVLASALTLAEQKERRRLSYLLHEHLQQILFGAKLNLESLRLSAGEHVGADFQARLVRHADILARAAEMTRTLSVDLNPPVLHGEGLDVALRWLAGSMEKMYELDVGVQVEGPLPNLQEDMRVLLLQLVRELLLNVVKHAGVNRARVAMETRNGELLVTVTDAGVGFDPAVVSSEASLQKKQSGYGLYSVRERLALFGGRLDVRSVRGEGATMQIAVPVADPERGLYGRGEDAAHLHR